MKNTAIATLVLSLALCARSLAEDPAPEKPRLAVADFKVVGDVGIPDAGKAIAELLLPEFKSDKYQLVERSQLEALLNEQGLKMADIVEKPTLSQEKKIKGVRFLVVGTVVKFGDLAISARIVDVTKNAGDIVEKSKVSADDARGLKNALGNLAKSLQGLGGVGKEGSKEPATRTAAGKMLSLELGNGITMKLVLIPVGKFTMGSPANESDRSKSEEPQHDVTIGKPFYMGIHEVTQEQYEAVIGSNPSRVKGAKNPVEWVSWNDAVAFCEKLSAKTSKTVRLPTEAEWEYACRAGTQTRFSFGDDEGDLGGYAWYRINSGNTAHRVGEMKPNAFGLYDMHGNVAEWCSDWAAISKATRPQRAQRGGAWASTPQRCRSASRDGSSPDMRFIGFGFRVVVPGVD